MCGRRSFVQAGLMAIVLAGLWAVSLGGQGAPTRNEDWYRPYPAFKIIDNVYWVGTYDLSTYLITSRDGHILVNTGFPETVPQIAKGVESLGFKMSDVKVLTATHGHGDHVAGLAALKKLTGAQMVMSTADAELLETGGASDFRFGDQASARFDNVSVDRTLADGGRTYRVGIMNMGSINPGVTVNGMPKYPTIRDDYAKTFRTQKALQLDVFLASHAGQFRMHEKYKPGDPYNPTRFVDPAGYRAAVERLEKLYLEQLAKEKETKP